MPRTDLNKELDMIKKSPQFAAMQPAQAEMVLKQMESRIVDRFINQNILVAAAEKANIELKDADIDKAIGEIKERVPANVTLEDALKENGMSMKEFRKNLVSDLKIRKLFEKETAGITNITDEAVAKYYEDNKAQFNMPETTHARHILVKVDKNADEATKAAKKTEIEGYRKQLVDGTAKFEDLAAKHSDCPSGKRGGDLGTFGRGQMVPEFDKAAFEQEIDAIGPVIETSFGYHIIQVTERTKAGERALDDVKDEIKEHLTNKAKQDFVEGYIKSLRDKAEITYGDK
jgi:peptidyl-prolyl cis-trans isomerase C